MVDKKKLTYDFFFGFKDDEKTQQEVNIKENDENVSFVSKTEDVPELPEEVNEIKKNVRNEFLHDYTEPDEVVEDLLKDYLEIYKRRQKEESSSFLKVPEVGKFLDESFDDELHDVKIYDRYNFSHKYDLSLATIENATEILTMIESSTVTIICGATGCGKTTQVPQLILDEHRVKDKPCNIIVSQPRRIAAISIAKRVCDERHWQLGELVGYSVAHDKVSSVDTRISYVTVGVLLQRIINNWDVMKLYTHIIIDEVHERSLEIDLILLILKRYLSEYSANTKVILMSATLQSDMYSEYFAHGYANNLHLAPVYKIKGSMFDVETFYLEDIPFIDKAYRCTDNENQEPLFTRKIRETIELILTLLPKFDKKFFDETKVNQNSVLVFLPGAPEIEETYKSLIESAVNQKIRVLQLHSQVSTEDQARIFKSVEIGWRKVILTTNIAESSITVPDVKYVIDTCLSKRIEFDRQTSLSSLKLSWISKSSANQRKGRAGRVSKGLCLRLINKNIFGSFEEYEPGEMKRFSLDYLVLRTKQLNIGPAQVVLKDAIEPPNISDVNHAVLNLKEVGALTMFFDGKPSRYDGEITGLGQVMVNLPLDIKFTKFIVISYLLGLLDEAVIISAMSSVGFIYYRKVGMEYLSYCSKMDRASDSFSDHIMYLQLYREYKIEQRKPSFSSTKRRWAEKNFVSLKRLVETDYVVDDIFRRLVECHIKPHGKLLDRNIIQQENDLFFLKIALAAAFYPYYYTSADIDIGNLGRLLSGLDPFRSVYVTSIDSSHNFMEILKTHLYNFDKVEKVQFNGCRGALQYKKDNANELYISKDIYLAVKQRSICNIKKSTEDSSYRNRPFSGPHSPLELKFSSISKSMFAKMVKIPPSSVNSVAIYNIPMPNLLYVIVGSDISISPNGSNVLVRNSTLMPPFIGMLELLVLLFTHDVEFRLNESGDKIIGALCGLGYSLTNTGIAVPYFEDHDIEIKFTFDFTNDDIDSINRIRKIFNNGVSNKLTDTWGANFLIRWSELLKEDIYSLFAKERNYVDPAYFSGEYFAWNQISPDLIASDDVSNCQIVYKSLPYLLI